MKNFASLIICVFLTVGLANAQEAAYRFEKGKEYKYLIEQSNLTLQEVPGQTITTSTEVTMSVVYTLVDVLENGNLKMQATIENALAINEGPNGTQTIGADMAGKSVIFEMSPNGPVVDVDSSIRKIESEGVMLLGGATSIFPRLDASKISEGSTWNTSEVDTSGSEESGWTFEETQRNYEIKGKKTVSGLDCFEVFLTSEAERDGKMIRGDQEMSISGTRNGKGTIMYSKEAGVIASFVAEMNMDQVVVIPANNMRVPITATQNIKIELVNQ